MTDNIYDTFCVLFRLSVSFHTFVMCRKTNYVNLLLFWLFSFPVCWLAATLRFSQRLSAGLCHCQDRDKSGVGNVINNKQWKVRPCAFHLQMVLETFICNFVSQFIANSSLLPIHKIIHTQSIPTADYREIFPKLQR